VLLVLAAAGGAADEPAATTKTTKLRILLPAKRGEVMVDGKRISTTVAPKGKEAKVKPSAVREVEAPPLREGKKELEVTAVWWTNNYTKFLRTAKVTPRPGETTVVDLRKPDRKNPDKIEIRYVPTPEDVVDRMCKLAKVGKDDVVYDLGCGDGRMVIMAVVDFKAKRGVGVDLDSERIDESKANAKVFGTGDKIDFRLGDVLNIKDLSEASVVMLYMGEDINKRLRPILEKTLKPGSRIVSHAFGMGDWKPDEKVVYKGVDDEDYTLYLWTVKEKKKEE